MADPLSISAGILAVTGACLQSAQFLKKLRDIYKDSEMTISVMCSECTVMSASLAQIQTMILRGPPQDHQSAQFQPVHDTFETALTGCMVIISALEKELRELLPPEEGGEEIGYRTKVKLVWQEGRMKDLLGQMRGQHTGLSLLIQLLEMESLATMQQTVNENADTLEEIKKRTMSIRSAYPDISTPESIFNVDIDVRTITSNNRTGPENESLIGSSTFAFDDQILNSFAYRKALVSLQLRAKTRSEPVSDSVSESPKPPQGHQEQPDPEAIMKSKMDLRARVQQLISEERYNELGQVWLTKESLNLIGLNSPDMADDPEITAIKGSLLHQAAFQGNTTLIQWLLLNGANPYQKDVHGKPPEQMTTDKRLQAFIRESPAAIVAKTMHEKRRFYDPQFRTYSGNLSKWEVYHWEVRWFVLDEKFLSYYLRQSDENVICCGAISLSIVQVASDSTDNTKLQVKARRPGGDEKQETIWDLKAYDSVKCSLWHRALSNSIEYLKKQSA